MLPVVRLAEQRLRDRTDRDHEYLPQKGLQAFTGLSEQLLLGRNSKRLAEGKVTSIQTVGGTNALRTGLELLRRAHVKPPLVFLPSPTWPIHSDVILASGMPPPHYYRYVDEETGELHLKGLLNDLHRAPRGSVVVLHTCAHNPTGVDPSKSQWLQIRDVVVERALIPFFDTAYLGFVTGDPEEDAFPIRLFASTSIDFLIALSYSKTLGLYGQRVGCLVLVSANKEQVPVIQGNLLQIVRSSFSSPPAFGARIVAEILSDGALRTQWIEELNGMVDRIRTMRSRFQAALIENETPGEWGFFKRQVGMFSHSGLKAEEVEFLRDKYHIYMTGNGRICFAGLTEECVQYVAAGMKDAIRTRPSEE